MSEREGGGLEASASGDHSRTAGKGRTETSPNAEMVLALLDWKRRVLDLCRQVRAHGEPEKAWLRWRSVRDELFRRHPQSPVPVDELQSFHGLSYYPYDPMARVLAVVSDAPREQVDMATSGAEQVTFTRFGVASFELYGRRFGLDVYWLEGYGGGLFLPFRDQTSGDTTFGAGRYLLDTAKGADLGSRDGLLVLDFNFAYNPSCSYDPSWVCPLSPAANRLPVRVEAGENIP